MYRSPWKKKKAHLPATPADLSRALAKVDGDYCLLEKAVWKTSKECHVLLKMKIMKAGRRALTELPLASRSFWGREKES